uniref:Uncharacterized protein n=1 Tax=Solanum lycopersicum TaxID=4081 RepID=A0A3Q7GTD1_SOLLC
MKRHRGVGIRDGVKHHFQLIQFLRKVLQPRGELQLHLLSNRFKNYIRRIGNLHPLENINSPSWFVIQKVAVLLGLGLSLETPSILHFYNPMVEDTI